MNKNFGTVDFEGKTYTLLEEPKSVYCGNRIAWAIIDGEPVDDLGYQTAFLATWDSNKNLESVEANCAYNPVFNMVCEEMSIGK